MAKTKIYKSLAMAVDLFFILSSILVAYAMYRAFNLGFQQRFQLEWLLLTALASALAAVFYLDFLGLYDVIGSFLYAREIQIIIKGLVTLFVLVNLLFVVKDPYVPSRLVFGLSLVFSITGLVLFRLFVLISRKKWPPGPGFRNILIAGFNGNTKLFLNTLMRHKPHGYRIMGILDNKLKGPVMASDGMAPPAAVPWLGNVADIINVDLSLVHALYIFPVLPARDVTLLVARAKAHNIPYYLLPEGMTNLFYNAYLRYGQSRPYITRPVFRPAFYYRPGKRAFDLVLALVLLILLAPLLLLLVLCTKLSSPGPVFFRQKRVGKGGRQFTMFKFRTMYMDAREYDISPAHQSDPRITPFGQFLRRTSLDELPQLYNVLKGQMSIVGPRPEMPFIVAKYTELEAFRLRVKPGITGIWQISAARSGPIHEAIEYDLFYVFNRSLSLDVAIFLETLVMLFYHKGY